MGYDVKCYDLASEFLSDEKDSVNTIGNRAALAQLIQDTIEQEIEDMQDRPPLPDLPTLPEL